jgi:predicted secreted Zn-dependent protease
MFTIAWTFIKPYLSNVFFYIIAGLVIICAVQTGRCYVKSNQIEILTVKLTAANDKLAIQATEFQKLKAMADALDVKLKTAYAENAEIAKAHAKNIEELLKSRLPATATCDDAAKWAKDIARRKAK